MSTRVENTTIPFHIARAYGQPSPSRASAASTGQALAGTAPIGRIAPADRADISPASGKLGELVAAVVPGRADFASAGATPVSTASTSTPTASTGSTTLGADRLPFYRRPSDQNEVAVAIRLGRSVDVSG